MFLCNNIIYVMALLTLGGKQTLKFIKSTHRILISDVLPWVRDLNKLQVLNGRV